MFTLQELEEDKSLLVDLKEDVRDALGETAGIIARPICARGVEVGVGERMRAARYGSVGRVDTADDICERPVNKISTCIPTQATDRRYEHERIWMARILR